MSSSVGRRPIKPKRFSTQSPKSRRAGRARRGRKPGTVIKAWDVAIVAIVLGLTGTLAWRVYAAPSPPAVVHVRAVGGEWYYPLDRNREIDLPGPLGVTKVAIENGTVRVLDSPCPLKTCVHAGAVSRADSVLACLPNRVLVTVEGRHEKPYDAESH